jgi:hypothetical protein
MSFSNLSVSYFMVYWLPQSYEIFFGNRKKNCRYIHGLLKNRYKVLLGVRQISQMRCLCRSQPCSLKNTSLTFSILYSIYILIHRSFDIPPQSEISRRSIMAEIIHVQMNRTICSRFISFLHEMFFPYSFVQSLLSHQSK